MVPEASVRGQLAPLFLNLVRQDITVGACAIEALCLLGHEGREGESYSPLQQHTPVTRNCPSRPHFFKASPPPIALC